MADTSQLPDDSEELTPQSGVDDASSRRASKRVKPLSQIPLPFAPPSPNIIISDREQLRALLSSLPVLLFALDRQANLLMLEGKGLAEFTPVQRQSVGRSFFEFYPESHENRQRLAHALDGTVVSWTERIGDRTLVTTLSPLRDRDGIVTGLLGVGLATPTTSQEMTGEREAGLTSPGSQFFAQVSHEFRTPLNSIVGFANLLSNKQESRFSEQDLFYVQRIIGNATHLLGVVSDMLNLSVIETGKVTMVLSEVDLGDLIRETIGEIGVDARGGALEMRTEIPEGVLPVVTDRQKLKQVLINLLANARKFTQQGSITVSVVMDEFLRPTRIDVQDNGMGISEEKLEAVFEAFERGEQAVGQYIEGTGLGLTISRALCKLMGYSLRTTSELGKGSTFAVDFSLRSTPQAG